MRVLEIIAQITTILGLGVIIFQIWMTTRWNRRVSNFNFINTEVSARLELDARHAIESAGVTFQHTAGWGLSDDEAKRLIADLETAFAINQFLNDYENLCAAFQVGILDKGMFRRVHAGRLVFWHRILAAYIAAARVEYGDPKIWIDFVTTADEVAAA
jgi:hypothetical protein